MNLYKDYIEENKKRKEIDLNPKPIDDGNLLTDIIRRIKDVKNVDREACLNFFIYNVTPGTTSAASVKSNFLKKIILNKLCVKEISPNFAFELLSHMKGGSSVEVLLDLALGIDEINAKKAANILKCQVFLYEADMQRLEAAYKDGNIFC